MSDITVTVTEIAASVTTDAGDTVVVTSTVTELIDVGIQGPAGPQGIPGYSRSFEFIQSLPSSVWTITHDLGKTPSVTIVDSAGSLVEGDVTYIGTTGVVVRFGGSFAGQAVLN